LPAYFDVPIIYALNVFIFFYFIHIVESSTMPRKMIKRHQLEAALWKYKMLVLLRKSGLVYDV